MRSAWEGWHRDRRRHPHRLHLRLLHRLPPRTPTRESRGSGHRFPGGRTSGLLTGIRCRVDPRAAGYGARSMSVTFTVKGQPKPGGSKKAFVNPKTDRVVVLDDSGKGGKEWRKKVVEEAEKHAP